MNFNRGQHFATCHHNAAFRFAAATVSALSMILGLSGIARAPASSNVGSTAGPDNRAVACPPQFRQVPASADPLGYRPWPGRCEGRYDYRPYSGTTLWLAGFTERFDSFSLDSHRALIVEWDLPGDEPISIEAVSLAPRSFYRMDAVPPAIERSFTWPLNVLAGLGFGGSEIGVLSHVSRSIERRERDVLVPLRIGPKRPTQRSPTFTLLLVSPNEIRKAYVRVTSTEPGVARPAPNVFGGLRSHGAYGVELSIDRPAAPGIYGLEVGVELTDGSIDSLPKTWFLNPRPNFR